MAYEYGRVNDNREACVSINLNNTVVECVIDTGFTGALVLPQSLLESLHIEASEQIDFRTVGGVWMTANITTIECQWLGEIRIIDVIVSESDDSLIGTELLDGARLTIDYLNNSVIITNETDVK
jgi:clan AA aspartic protease